MIFELLEIYLVVFDNFIVEKIIIFNYGIIGVVGKLWNFGINVISMMFGLVRLLFDIYE